MVIRAGPWLDVTQSCCTKVSQAGVHLRDLFFEVGNRRCEMWSRHAQVTPLFGSATQRDERGSDPAQPMFDAVALELRPERVRRRAASFTNRGWVHHGGYVGPRG